MSDNHNSLYQEEYLKKDLDSQDVEAFYWQELDEVMPEERSGLIETYETGKGVRKDESYALLLRARWRIS